jgi:hypothetical protein
MVLGMYRENLGWTVGLGYVSNEPRELLRRYAFSENLEWMIDSWNDRLRRFFLFGIEK